MGVRVLTIDDSPLFLGVLSRIISATPGLEHAGSAPDGARGVEALLALHPDVVTLDVEMPVMDGLATLRRIMEVRPTPVIMVSSLTRGASSVTVKALQSGACDFVTKPSGALGPNLERLRDELTRKILALASSGARLRAPGGVWMGSPRERPEPAGNVRESSAGEGGPARILAIGASTGGTSLLSRILAGLPPHFTATVVAVQHLPAVHAEEFARRLAAVCRAPVSLARDGGIVTPGHVFLAPGDGHLTVFGSSFRFIPAREPGEHAPSLDVTFTSLARRYGSGVSAAVLTGMGNDGAAGVAAVKDAGGRTVAQDEATSVVFGMPRAAAATGKVDAILPAEGIARWAAGMVGK